MYTNTALLFHFTDKYVKYILRRTALMATKAYLKSHLVYCTQVFRDSCSAKNETIQTVQLKNPQF